MQATMSRGVMQMAKFTIRPPSPSRLRPPSPSMSRPSSPSLLRPPSPCRFGSQEREMSTSMLRPPSPSLFRPPSPSLFRPPTPCRFGPQEREMSTSMSRTPTPCMFGLQEREMSTSMLRPPSPSLLRTPTPCMFGSQEREMSTSMSRLPSLFRPPTPSKCGSQERAMSTSMLRPQSPSLLRSPTPCKFGSQEKAMSTSMLRPPSPSLFRPPSPCRFVYQERAMSTSVFRPPSPSLLRPPTPCRFGSQEREMSTSMLRPPSPSLFRPPTPSRFGSQERAMSTSMLRPPSPSLLRPPTPCKVVSQERAMSTSMLRPPSPSLLRPPTPCKFVSQERAMSTSMLRPPSPSLLRPSTPCKFVSQERAMSTSMLRPPSPSLLRPPTPCRFGSQERAMSTSMAGVHARLQCTMFSESRVYTPKKEVPKLARKRPPSLKQRPPTPVKAVLPSTSMHSRYSTQAYAQLAGNQASFTGIMHSDLSPREVEAFLHAKPFEVIPGPTAIHQSIPFASTRLLYYPFSSYKVENLGDMLSKMQTAYGPVFRVQIGAEWMVLVDDLDDIERVVRSAELEEERGVRLLPKSKGPLDMLQRRVDDPSLSWLSGGHTFSKKMREAIYFHINSFDVKTEGLREQERIADDFIGHFQQLQDSPTEVQNLCARYAYESVSHTCFSQRLGLLGENYNSDREKQNLLECYQTVVRCLGETMTGTRVLHLLFEDPFAKRFRDAKRTVQEWERELVRGATEMGEDGASLEGPSQKSLLTALMDDKTFSDQEIQDAMHSIVTAGGDIISNALQMMLYSLATNPDKQEKLVTELERTLTPDFEIDIINLNCSDYLNAVVRESLRLHFPLSAGGRVELANNVVLNNYFVPAGTHIVVNSRRAAKNPLWFDHPDSFEPERWLGEAGDKIPSQAFMPFGFANSLCPTSFFSMQKFQLALVKILDRYKVDLPSDYYNEPIETVYTPFLAPKDPLPFIFTPRDRSRQPKPVMFGFPGIPPK